MTATLEVVAEFPVVVYLAVEDDPRGPVFVGDRLITRPEVDDAQPSHPQGHARSDVHALAVRAAVPECRTHGADATLLDGRAVEIDDAGDAAHGFPLERPDFCIPSSPP